MVTKTIQNRSHERLLHYWQERRAGRDFPGEADIDPDALADIWPSCFLVGLDDVTRRLGYRYSYLGDALIEAYGGDLAAAPELVPTSGMPMARAFDEVVRTRGPVSEEGEFTNPLHLRIRYRACMLPLGAEGRVTHILGCMRWKLY